MMRLLLWFDARRLAVVLLAVPLLAGAAYFFGLAADRFVSESVVGMRQAQSRQPAIAGMALLIAGVTPPAREDMLLLKQYIRSLELLRRLDARLQLRRHYEAEHVDPVFRLWPGASQEWFHEYFHNRVDVSYDEVSSLLTVRVQGFEPRFAQALNRAILEECERFVNETSQRMAREQMGFADGEVQAAAQRVRAAQGKVLAFQSEYGEIDPAGQAQAAGKLGAELHAQLAKVEAELRSVRTFLQDDAYQVKALQSQVSALRGQIDAERSRATQSADGAQLSAIASQFQDLNLQLALAQEQYRQALGSMDNARIDAARKLKSLVVVEPPSLPQTALYPRRLYSLATLLLVCGLVYGIACLTIATVREHQD